MIVVKNIVEDIVIMKKSDAEVHLQKMEKFSKKN
jgi:hypothetical protein